MNEQQMINELRATLFAAAAGWERKYLSNETGHCTKCGNTTPVIVTVMQTRRTALDSYDEPQRVYCCGQCLPNVEALAADAEKLREQMTRRSYRQQRATALRLRRGQIMAIERTLPLQYRPCRFGNYVPQDAAQADAVDQVRTWTRDAVVRERFPNLVIQGPPGVGKTHLLTAAWRSLLRGRSSTLSVNDVRVSEAWRRSHDAYDDASGYAGPDPDQIVDELVAPDVLLWDDLGKTKLTESWSSVLYRVFDERYEQRKPTLVTTNYGPRELAARVAPHTADRVLSGIGLVIAGRSMRAA